MYRCLWLKNTNSREKQIYTRCKHFLNLGQKRNQAFYPLLLDRDVYYSNKREGVKYFCDNVQFIHSFILSRGSLIRASYFFQGWGKTSVVLRCQQHAVWVEGTLLCCLLLKTNIEDNGCTSSYIRNHKNGYKRVLFIFSGLKIDYLHCFLQLVDHLQMCFWWSVLMIEIGKKYSPCQGGADA